MRAILYTVGITMLLLCHSGFVSAQPIKRDGLKIQPENLDQYHNQLQKRKYNNHYYLDIQFNHIPNQPTIELLNQYGIQLISYRHNNIYRATIPTNLTNIPFNRLGIEKFITYDSASKIASSLIDDTTRSSSTTTDIAIIFHEEVSTKEINEVLSLYSLNVNKDRLVSKNIVIVSSTNATIEALSQHPAIQFIDEAQDPDQSLNQEIRTLSGANIINSLLNNEYGFKGEGITVGIGDGGELGNHIDFDDRKITECTGNYAAFGQHPDHVSGIFGGGGNLNERHRGVAPDADIVLQKTGLIHYYAEDYYDQHQMVLTNNSYGTSFNCDKNGSYNYTSQKLDKQAKDLPKVLHVFAAGNSGSSTCSPYPKGFKTVLRSYQSSKNVLTVGNAKKDLTVHTGSSKGPVLDGRLKPEICGIGNNITSTGRSFNYFVSGGTSMAAPAVTGILALMNEAYRENNNNTLPDGALMKAIACNTAQDVGNPGPDYSAGFGLIDGKRAIDAIQGNQFFTNTITNGQVKEQTLEVEAGLDQINILLYWHDVEAASNTGGDKALINDLDIEIINPQGETVLPWVLNPAPTAVQDPAIRGVDTLNNIEQVTIATPVAGTYTIRIKGSDVPMGPQSYVVTYDKKEQNLLLTHPFGKEKFEPNTTVKLNWYAPPNNTSTFNVEYSIDNGNSWTTIATNIAADKRIQNWTTPSTYTTEGVVRITSSDGQTSINEQTFSIIAVPTNFTITPLCQGYLAMTWEGESDYGFELTYFNGKKMKVIDTVFTNTVNIKDDELEIGTEYWFAVNKLTNTGHRSLRTVAIQAIPQAEGDCSWTKDLYLSAVLSRSVGRKNTSIAFTSTETMSIQIINKGAEAIDSTQVYYQINDASPVMEMILEAIAPGDTIVYDFNQKMDLSNTGDYPINVWLENANDNKTNNDSIMNKIVFSHIANQPLDATSTILANETFDNITPLSYDENKTGLEQLLQWDFNTNSPESKVQLRDGALHITPTEQILSDDYNAQLLWTLNLSSIDPTTNLYLGFTYINDTLQPLSEPTFKKNQVLVRGSDQNDWILLAELDGSDDSWKEVNNLDVKAALQNAGQSLSSSFQVQFSQLNESGLSLDNVSLGEIVPLPVEFGTFSLERLDNSQVKLNWTTYSELNNDYFDVEVAVGSENVQADEFTTIGRVLGNGTTNIINHYEFIDHQANKSGVWYYRIKQVDFNGKLSYSPIETIAFPTLLQASVYPNPFKNRVYIDYQSSKNQFITVEMIDNMSRIVYRQEFKANSGKQRFNLNFDRELESGVYYIKITDELGNNTLQKLTKVKK